MAQKHSLQIYLSFILYPLSLVFSYIGKIRCFLYQHNILKSYTSRFPVICVGNISWGGTGKSPIIDYLLKLFQQKSVQNLVISRGYGVKLPNYPFVLDKNTVKRTLIVPDEPAMLVEKNPHATIIINPNRVQAVQFAEKNFPLTSYILMDDGFQHFALARDINLVLLDKDDIENSHFLATFFSKTYNWNTVIPLGSWREHKSALKRATAFMLKCSPKEWEEKKEILQNKLHTWQKPIFGFSLEIEKIEPLFPNLPKFTGDYTLLAGIGNPEQFQKSAENFIGRKAKATFFIPDHATMQKYVPKILAIQSPFLCTEKDAIKLRQIKELENKAIYYTNTKTIIHSQTISHDFDTWLFSQLTSLPREKNEKTI